MAEIIDALVRLPGSRAMQAADCVPIAQDFTPEMQAAGVAGAVFAPRNCEHCQNPWNCADRRTDEVIGVVTRNPRQMRGLGCYDPLRVGESLRWLDDGVRDGHLAGAYAPSDCCVSGLSSPRMYPLYGSCAKLRCPVVIDFYDQDGAGGREHWQRHRPQIEAFAADFPELDILLAPPPHTDAESIVRTLQRFPHISFLLSPGELHAAPALCEYMEQYARDRVLFRSTVNWQTSVEALAQLSLGAAVRRAYTGENARRLFAFPEFASPE